MEASMVNHVSAIPMKHPLLSELEGVIHHLKLGHQPVTDGKDHLTPLCETLEAIFRKGLKKPNSWFGLYKQDYWSWIEPLQDYYFNEKQNPLLRQVVGAISASPKMHSVEGRGRCFIRVALCQKLISVPIEHLIKNPKHTQYWYNNDSIIGNPTLRTTLMRLLFEVTEVDFHLSVDQSSFLDETWIIPVFKTVQLPPIKTLDIKINYVENHAVIVHIDQDSLLAKAGVEVGDALEELCGEHIQEESHGRLKQVLLSNTMASTDVVVVKEYLPDGSPFFPIMRRKLVSNNQAKESAVMDIPKRRPSIIAQSQGSTTEYTVVYLGREQDRIIGKSIGGDLLDDIVSRVLNSSNKPEEVVLHVSRSEVLVMTSDKREPFYKFGYEMVYGCGQGTIHKTCFTLLVAQSNISTPIGEKKCIAHVLEAPSLELAHGICSHIAQGFNKSSLTKR